jgi:hypothetical protein
MHSFERTFRLSLAGIAAGLFTLLAAAPAAAADSVNVTVNANVIGVCKFFGAGYTMTIANSGADIDPSLGADATGSVAIEYRCSNGQAPTFGVPASLTLTGAGSMDATFTSSNTGPGTGMGAGQAKTLTVNGTITSTEFQNKPIGAYTNTLTVTVNP